MASVHRHVALLLAAAMPACANAQQNAVTMQQARAAMAAGIDAAQQGDLARAQAEFARAVKLAPQVSATHAALGSVELELGQIEPAFVELQQAHTLTPDDISIDLNLARSEAARGHSSVAVQLFQQALASPSPPRLSTPESMAFAAALAASGDLAGAQNVLSAALAAAPDSAPLHDALGSLLAQQGKLDEALAHFQQALALSPSLAIAQYHLGVALLTLERAADALAPLRSAAQAEPRSYDFQLQLGRALSANGSDSEALEHLHRAAELRAGQSNPQSLYALALALQASGDAATSLPIFAEAVRDASAWKPLELSSALTNYALARVQTGDAKGAIPIYTQALALGSDSATLREDFGVAYIQQSDLVDAIAQFRAGLALEPDNAHLHYDLGLALKLQDNLAAAVPEFERAAQLDATLPDPAYTLGVIYMQQGRFADAATQLQHAVALQPANGDAWALLGSVLRDSGDPTGAMDALRHAVTLEPEQPNLHVEIAALESQAGQKDEAVAERKIAADLSRAAVSRQRASFALKSGRALLAENKLQDAIVQLNTAVQADPNAAEPHQLLAEVYARQGKAADAAIERGRATALTKPTQQP